MRRTWMLVVFRGQRVNCYHSIISNLANNLFFYGKAFFRSIITSEQMAPGYFYCEKNLDASRF